MCFFKIRNHETEITNFDEITILIMRNNKCGVMEMENKCGVLEMENKCGVMETLSF